MSILGRMVAALILVAFLACCCGCPKERKDPVPVGATPPLTVDVKTASEDAE